MTRPTSLTVATVTLTAAAAVLLGLARGACAGDAAAPPEKAGPAAPGKAEPFAVIELFTSEGCSSCPPADRVMSDVLREARADGRRVFPLAFHVDYWNRLGWADRFADPDFSDRQRAYAARFKLDGLYTPQAIVNGRVEFVGSDRKRVDREIKAALEAPAAVAVTVTAAAPDARRVVIVDYAVTGATAKATLKLALVERDLETQVPRGENAGRTLPHDNVVRAFQVLPLDKSSGRAELTLPAGADVSNTSVVAYVQDAEMRTLGAAAVDLAPARAAPERAK